MKQQQEVLAIEISPANMHVDVPRLMEFDAAIFEHPSDRFDERTWRGYQTFLISTYVGPVGAIALGRDVSISSMGDDLDCPGTLFLASIGVLPAFVGRGVGTQAMAWILEYAKKEGFSRIVSNFRVSNHASAALHKKAGFLRSGVAADFYSEPTEDAVIVEIWASNFKPALLRGPI